MPHDLSELDLTGVEGEAFFAEPTQLYRDTVKQERYRDIMGRPIYFAVDANGCELDRMVAVSPAETQRVLRRLWEAVYRARERDHERLRLLK